MEAAPVLFAEEDQVLVGKNEHQAFVARPAREGDDAVLVRWESTKKEEEVAIGDVKKIDLDAKRQTRGKRREAAAPARREPQRKRRKKKETDAAAQDPSSAREEIERHVKALLSGGLYSRLQMQASEALEKLANEDDANRTAIAQRLVALVTNGAAGGQESAAGALEWLAAKNASNQAAIAEAGGIEALVALVRSGRTDSRRAAVRALEELAKEDDANRSAIAQRLVGLLSGGSADDQEQAAAALADLAYSSGAIPAAIAAAGGIEQLVALATNGAAGGQEAACHVPLRQAARALRALFINNDANSAAIVSALLALVANGTAHRQNRAAQVLASLDCDGAIAPLVALVTNGAASCQENAAAALGWLADNTYGPQYFGGPRPTDDAVNRVAIAAAGGIEALVALVRSGAAGGQATAALALQYLAKNNAAHKAAIVAAGGVEALVALLANGSDCCKRNAEWALTHLPIAEYASRLHSENASLQRRLDRYEGSGAIDVTQDGDADDAQHRDTGLRDLHDRKTQESFVKIKRENVALEDRVLCTICMEADAPRTVLFGPCNHFLACASCADALQECPNCRVPITARTSIANTS